MAYTICLCIKLYDIRRPPTSPDPHLNIEVQYSAVQYRAVYLVPIGHSASPGKAVVHPKERAVPHNPPEGHPGPGGGLEVRRGERGSLVVLPELLESSQGLPPCVLQPSVRVHLVGVEYSV